MKKNHVLLVLLVLATGLTDSALAERWGRPGADLDKCQWSLGIEYNYIEAEWDLRLPKGLVYSLGEQQVVLNQILVTVSHGFTDTVETYLKMGGTSTDLTDGFLTGSEKYRPSLAFNEDLKSNLEFTIVGGVAATLYEEGKVKVGTLAQLTYFTFDDTAEAWDFTQGMDAQVLALEAALMASYQMGKLTPYAGICMVIYDADIRYRATDPFAVPIFVYDLDVEQEDWFGMIVGADYELMENVFLSIEMTHVSEGVGLSTGVTCAF